MSRDFGKTWKREQQHVLWGSYFFLSDEIVDTQRSVQTVLNVLSELGGTIEIFMGGLILFMTLFNDFNFKIKQMKIIYLDHDKDWS